MTQYTSYVAHINEATLVDCKPIAVSLFDSSEQTFHIVVEKKEGGDDYKLHKFTVNEREKNIVLERVNIGDEIIVLEEHFDQYENNDIILDNESLLKNDAGNVAQVNHILNAEGSAFDEDAYEHYYNALEYTYERMTEAVRENVETIYLYLTTLADMKNGQTVKVGTETLIRKSIGYALKQDVSFEQLMVWFDLEQPENIKTAMNNADSEMREEFFKVLVATKTDLNLEEAEIFQCFKNLALSKEPVANAE